MKRRNIRSLIIAFLVIIGMSGVIASPAYANGGCTDHPNTEPCISKSGNWLYADFYQIKTPDASMYTYNLTIIKNGSAVTSTGWQRLNRTGRFGPISNNVATLPPTRGSAYARVQVRTSSGVLHYSVNSPTQTW
ncbi:hypothetical protein ACTMTF_47440 [Nonomuraea sp. ZG12]|uniref:hypothetical protein n=1 Tax=Nonomuraea sp. ZG12 TaxID=3452207 RepID=UPI003F8ABBBA